VREAQKRERLRSPETPRAAVRGGAAPELDQPRLLGRQLQRELREPVAKICQEPLCLVTMLKARDVVVGKAHENHVPARVPAPPLVGPQVEHVVE
jgi:hypothetical protein